MASPHPGTSRLRLRTKGGFLDKPVLDGQPLDYVAKVEVTIDPMRPPRAVLHIETDVVFNGRAYVAVKDIIPEASLEARAEFAAALNRADQIARGVTQRRDRRAVETDIPALLEALDGLGWGFHRKRGR